MKSEDERRGKKFLPFLCPYSSSMHPDSFTCDFVLTHVYPYLKRDDFKLIYHYQAVFVITGS